MILQYAMPELPEVEVTRRGLVPHLRQQVIEKVIVRQPRLRWPVPTELSHLKHQAIQDIKRRGKNLLLATPTGTIIIHLGMSGCLRLLPMNSAVQKHDHIDVVLKNQTRLRFTDPRRFGAWLWTTDDPL